MTGMLRLLLFVVLAALAVRAVRRAFGGGRGKGGGPLDDDRPRRSLAPERLVCGACGAEFDPEASGWICPRCGK